MGRKNIVILGSSGSIGENAIKVIEHLPKELRLFGVAAKSSCRRLAEQARKSGAKFAAIYDDSHHENLRKMLPPGCKCLSGREGLIELATHPSVDMVLCAIVGIEGLFPVLAAIRAGKDVAIASKEVLVVAGEIVMGEVRRHKVNLIPVDSEHCAVSQCLEGRKHSEIGRIILTASGGPFKGMKRKELASVTYKSALKHPTWEMGPKVTIDSATMMNKSLEVIEARWLFDIAPEKIDVVIHPQSVVHSMVEFIDGTVLAQMSSPDMRYPIQRALTFPVRHRGMVKPLDFAKLAELSFEAPDRENFPSLDFAYEALKRGGTMPAVMNAANEIAVERFRLGEIRFPDIWSIIEKTMYSHNELDHPCLDAILKADLEARGFASELKLKR